MPLRAWILMQVRRSCRQPSVVFDLQAMRFGSCRSKVKSQRPPLRDVGAACTAAQVVRAAPESNVQSLLHQSGLQVVESSSETRR